MMSPTQSAESTVTLGLWLGILAVLSFPASASLLSDIPVGSIDRMYQECFDQPQCAKQIDALTGRYSKERGGEPGQIVPILHSCLANNMSMSICGSFLQFAIDDELAQAKERLELQAGGKCARKLTRAAEKKAQNDTLGCFDRADGEGSESRLVDTSCRTDLSRSTLRYLKDADLCKACGHRAKPEASIEASPCKLK